MTRDAPLVVRAEMRALPEVLDHVDARALEAGLDRGARFDVRLAVEEIVTNIIRHGYDEGAPGPVEVACASSAGRCGWRSRTGRGRSIPTRPHRRISTPTGSAGGSAGSVVIWRSRWSTT